MQVAYIAAHPRRTVNGLLVRRQLNRISRHEPRSEAQVARRLNEQPCKVATRAVTTLERLFGCEDAGFHPNVVAKRSIHEAVQIDEHVDDLAAGNRDIRPGSLQEVFESLTRRRRLQVRGQIPLEEW